jgi:hypothetical protein
MKVRTEDIKVVETVGQRKRSLEQEKLRRTVLVAFKKDKSHSASSLPNDSTMSFGVRIIIG